MKVFSFVLVGVLTLVLAGCAGRLPAPEQPRAPDRVEPHAPVEEKTERPRPAEPLPALPAAARGLAEKAEQASAAGNHDEAAALLERALRIAPRHPVIWQNLAVVRYRQGDYRQAESLALKSNTLAGQNGRTLKRQNWSLIATARELDGDAGGAARAMEQARSLE